MGTELELLTGSIRYIGMELSRKSEEDFTIESMHYEILDRDRNIIDSGSDSDAYGIIDGNMVFYVMDTTKVDGSGNLLFEVGKVYTVCYSVHILGMVKIIKSSRKIKITRC